jgi:hypothetical protein
MSGRRPEPARTASTLLRRHGDSTVYRVVQDMREREADSAEQAAWWQRVFDAIWSLTANERRGDRSVH